MFYDSSSGRRNSRGSYSIISYILINYIYSSLPSIDYHSFNGLSVQTPYIINFIHRLYHPSFLQLIPDPWLLSSLAPTIHHWSIACTFQRFFTCSLIHCLYHPSLLLLITDSSHVLLHLLTDLSLVPSVAPSIDHWSIACIIQRSFNCSPISRFYHPSLFLLVRDPSHVLLLVLSDPSHVLLLLLSDPSHVLLHLLTDPSLAKISKRAVRQRHNVTPMQKQIECNIIMYT